MQIVIDIPDEIYKVSQVIDVKYEDVIQIPLEVIANGTPLSKPGWIPVSERLPGYDEDVLVSTKSNIVAIGYIHPDDKVWVTDTADIFERVTAWKPLPKPYTESEGKA